MASLRRAITTSSPDAFEFGHPTLHFWLRVCLGVDKLGFELLANGFINKPTGATIITKSQTSTQYNYQNIYLENGSSNIIYFRLPSARHPSFIALVAANPEDKEKILNQTKNM